MALAGHTTTLKVSGTAVAMTGEATTSLGSGRWQITSTTRRIVDPSAVVTVRDTGTPVSETLWTFDYLFGVVTFSGYTPSGAITIDGSYLPVSAVAEVRGFTLSFGPDLLDTTTYDSGGAKQKTAGLVDASGSIEFLSLPTADLDGVAGGRQSFFDFLSDGTPKLIEARFGGAYYLRAWVMLEGVESGAEVSDLVKHTANFQLATQKAGASLGFGS